MPDLQALIAKLEEAEEGGRELDREIALATEMDPGPKLSAQYPDWQAPLFTESIDAALLIEKEGWWDISGPRRYLNIPTPSPNYWKATLTLWEPMREFVGWGATEALARRIAALKALAELKKGQDL